MNTLDTIRREVFQYLMERHYQAQERGEEFYFKLKVTDTREVPYFLQARVSAKPTLTLSFYGDRQFQQIAYLIIAENKQVFLVVELDARDRYDKLEDATYELSQYTQNSIHNNHNKEVRSIHAQFSPGEIQSIDELLSEEDVLGKIAYFLKKIKPEIDRCFEDIRPLPLYDYLFLDKEIFDEYLKSEPHFKPSEPIAKVNLRLGLLRVINFRGIAQCEINDLYESARWIVLTGRNGYGKTSVLQAIAAGLYGNYDESGRELVPLTAYIGVSYYANGVLIETDSRAPRADSIDKKLTQRLATYGSSRLQVTGAVSRETLEGQLPPTYSLFNSDGLLLNVEQLLIESKPYRPEFYNQLVELFKAIIPQLDRIEIQLEKKLPQVRYYEKDEAGNQVSGKEGLTFGQLAAGFRNLIAMVGDMVYRLSSNQEVENLWDLQGIVIIDEFELHLHPIYQKLLPEVLTKLFQHIQFIVSTHSPIPLLGIPKNVDVVLLHVSRAAETGIVVERLDVDFSTLTPNAILSSPIFGFHDLIPDSKSDDQMVRTEDTFAEVVADEQMRKNISEFLTPERQQELLNLIQKK